MKENAAAVQQLIEAGADSEELESVVDLESCNEMGRTPLVQACIKNAPEVITALLAARADVNIKDSSGRSAVYYAAMKENAAVVQQLIEAGADPEELEMLGCSGLRPLQTPKNWRCLDDFEISRKLSHLLGSMEDVKPSHWRRCAQS
ncbi:Acyl-CoA-binding domain-containing protein 6 [Symbiodinium microadriaticum]|uniref:Acyl-CoA-binding domain-containing protein 6 n=1 Tax=Symbiodinium microadriaticum TaxID=2951 RepID=A0A1Q9DNJ0_SYMMI|nr:Acyl-CoA-binding domain-containing protein 6 [Symbiodinium microadriaticum]